VLGAFALGVLVAPRVDPDISRTAGRHDDLVRAVRNSASPLVSTACDIYA
jgi:hypothetical protein